MKTKKYFSLQIKKAAKLYPAIIAINILLIICIAVGCILLINKDAASDEKQKLKVGIVGDLSHAYLDAGIAALQNLDSSRFSVDLMTLESEDEAKTMLSNGDISGYIRVPEGFVKAVIRMQNIPIAYVTNNTPVGFGSILMTEVAKTISNTIAETQRGIFGLQTLAENHDKEDDIDTHIDNINIEYITSVLNRTNSYQNEYVGMADGLSSGGYFVCGGIMMFLLLWGISCSSMLLKKDRSMEKLLVSKGQSVFSQVTSEYFTFFLITLFSFLLFTTMAGTVLQFTQSGIKELDYRYVTDFIKYIIALIPVLLMMTSLQFLFYEMVSGTVGVILLQFVFAIGTGYICGCLYPSHYFPVSIQKIASVLPTGVGVTYMRQTLSESLSMQSFAGAMIYFAAFFGLAVLVRKQRNEGDGR